ncbi:MAG: ABC transporter permease [Micromonosporaceae bacterium]|nr:ABC transporter permease [Micromonosporaceae bacterium]
MALMPTPATVAVRHFLFLKLRMLRNGLRVRGGGSARRLVTFLFGIFFGLWAALGGFAAFAAGSSAGSAATRIAVVGLAGGVLTLGWLLLPLLFFGVDETIDPARFALLPVPRRTLALGMVVAACCGVPAVATFVATLGLVIGGAIRGGPVGAAAAAVAAILTLLVCVVGSRAVTSAFAAMLRSRRMRDLAVILIAILAASIGPLQIAITAAVERGGAGVFTTAGRIMGWTPLAAAQVAVLDVSDGRWLMALARFAMVGATLALLAWWWSTTLESAMLGTTSAGPAGGRAAGPAAGAVRTLIPAVLRSLPDGQFTAIVARDLRYFWRDPRWRASLASMIIVSLFLPVALVALPGDGGAAPLPMVILFVGTVMGLALANVFGSDGLAFATQLLAGVPGRVELRARCASLTLITAPLLVVAGVVIGVAGGEGGDIPAVIGVGAAAFGASLAVGMFSAVFLPYPMPQTGNPFAVSTGGATMRNLLVFVGIGIAVGMTAPVIAVYYLLPAALSWVLLPLGLGWAIAAVLTGAYIAGDALDRRGPEVLQTIAPGV